MKPKSNQCSLPLFTLLALGGACAPALAGGFRLPDQDAFATARGEAFAATADNPSAIYYNPAGLTQLQGQNFRGGFYAIDLDPSYKNASGASFENQDKLHVVPQFFYAFTPSNSIVSYGLGLYSPIGLGLKWPQNAGFRTLGYESMIDVTTLNPSLAFKLGPNLSIGGGVTFNYAMLSLRQGVFSPLPGGDSFEFDGDGWDIGYNLGVLFQPCRQLSFGATYRSADKYELNGHSEANVPGFFTGRTSAHAELPTPYDAIFGVSYRPTPLWNFEFDADYTDWSPISTLYINQTQPTPLGSSLPLPLNWQPSWYYEFGATRYLDNGWHVSAGYIYNENSVPNVNYTPQVTDLDKHFFSVGVGHKGQSWDFDVAYQFGYGTSTMYNVPGYPANGHYDYFSHAIIASVGWHF
jgi:long-chain fatty acid transport protein